MAFGMGFILGPAIGGLSYHFLPRVAVPGHPRATPSLLVLHATGRESADALADASSLPEENRPTRNSIRGSAHFLSERNDSAVEHRER